ncbi:MAG: PDZ domain-containing protein [Acidobacteria bacterium]|nr:PDZ domain-containing protein [Acidobacteriota bacterium]
MKAIGFGAALMGLVLAGGLNAQNMFYYNVPPAGAGSYLGVGVAEVTPERAKALKLKEERGAEITSVEADSPAARAGLKAHDVVLEYNGQRVEGIEQFMRMVRETPAERPVRLTISRDGATQTLTATIGQRKGFGPGIGPGIGPSVVPPVDTERLQRDMERLREFRMPDIPRPNMSWQSGMLGVEAESLTDQLAEFFGVKEGVLIRSVVKDSAAAKAGMKAGDVITKVDDTKVASPREITSAARSLRSKKTFPVTVIRNHKEMTLSVTLEESRPARGSRSEVRPL